MRPSSDKLLLLIALLILGSVGGTVAAIFAGEESTSMTVAGPDLVRSVEDKAGARRAPGPSRRPDEQPASVVEERDDAPLVMPQDGEGLISGIVRNLEGEAVASARIALKLQFPYGELNYGLVTSFEAKVESDEEGRFAVAVPALGVFRLIVTHDLHAPAVREELRAGAELEIDLAPAAGMIGHVCTAGGAAVAGARLRIRREDSPWRADFVTGDDGRFGLAGLPAGKLVVGLSAAEYMPMVDLVVEVAAGEILERDFILEPGRAIIGTVVDENGSRVPDVQVRVGEYSSTGDDIGRFRIAGLDRNTHTIEFVADGFLTYHQNVNLSGSREVAEIEVKLARGGKATGFVLDDTGKPVGDAEVKVFQSWGNGDQMWDTGETRYVTRTDAQGSFEIDGLTVEGWSRFRARAAKEGYANAFSDTFRLQDRNQPANLSIVMRPGGTLSGAIRDESGRAIAGVKVTLNRNNVYEWNSTGDAGAVSALSDAEGHYEFDRLSEGQYRVSAMARGFATVYKSGIKLVGAAHSEGNDLVLREGGLVKGSVKTPEGEPVPGAAIQLNSNSSWGRARSNDAGEYQVENVGEGPYWVTATAPGYSRERKSKVFPVDGRIDFELRNDGYVWGRIVAGDDENPVRQFRVELQQESSRNGATSWRRKSQIRVNDPEGKFKIYAPDGSYRLVVIAKGYIRKEIDNVALSVDAEPEPMTIAVVAGGAVEGWVRDDQGRAMPWVQVYYRQGGVGRYRRAGNTEQDGYYYVDSLATGSYELVFDRRGRMPLGVHESVQIYGGGIARLDHVHQDPTLLFFRHILPEDARAAPRWMRIRVTSLDGRPLTISTRRWTEDGGDNQLDPTIDYHLNRGQSTMARELAPGDYWVEISAKGFETIRKPLSIRARDDLEFPVEMKRAEKRPR